MMKINEQLRIEKCDSLNYVIEQKYLTKLKIEAWKPIAYYGCIKDAYLGLLRRGIEPGDLESLDTILDKLDEIHEYIKNLEV